MRPATVYFSAMTLGMVVLATAVAAQSSAPMKSTAPEKMMPSDRAKKMRACDKMAMDQKIKMEDRASFVANCMASVK